MLLQRTSTGRTPSSALGINLPEVAAGMLQAGADALATVDINTPTLTALAQLVRGGRSAVAVLSPEGDVVTNLSTSDLRCAPPPPYLVTRPLSVLLSAVHPVFERSHAGQGLSCPNLLCFYRVLPKGQVEEI